MAHGTILPLRYGTAWGTMRDMSTVDLTTYLALPYRVEITTDGAGGGYHAAISQLKGCVASGDTVEEAYAALQEAKRAWIETALARGSRVPRPPAVDEKDYSGTFRVRLPGYLHRDLACLADDEGTSLNQLVVALLSEGVERLRLGGPVKVVTAPQAVPSSEAGPVPAYGEQPAPPVASVPGDDLDGSEEACAEDEDQPTRIHVEIYLAARGLAQHQDSFTVEELCREIERRFCDTRPGVETHINTHCVANAPRNPGAVYNYLWRLPDGRLRPFDPDRDAPDPTREGARTAPDPSDLPGAS